ncbi:MAG TPA: VIT domain-containing protein [Gemmataceae bacterium]|nr:VIT domain-containing protein [Gemmataceae bacterium]
MRRYVPVLIVLVTAAGPAPAAGLLIPEERSLPPLAMLNHKVSITIEDQVAVTRVEQTFRNHTDRALEATYVFPVPRGANVNRFSMWVDGKEVRGELVEAAKAREIYTSILRRTQDPGLLEYLGNNLFRMRVFPIPPRGDQKVTLSYTSVTPREADLVEYVYPLKTDGKAAATLEDFAITAVIRSQHAVQNVYSPTHALTLQRTNDKEVTVQFEKQQGLLDRNFQLFYSLGDKDIGLTALAHRPVAAENGYFLLLLTPKVTIAPQYQVPRDVVLVLDTSGSMRGPKMEQAKKALKYCLNNLGPQDRFALINFATTVNRYKNGLVESTSDQLEQARKWIDNLEATGGTAINDALAAALDLRPRDQGRMFLVVFFTDGQPTIGETNPDKILKNTLARNSHNTRIFTFGVGHDVNASMLDQLADQTRAVSTYVRPEEDIEVKVSSLHNKISHPVLANLKLEVQGSDVSLVEMYPPQLPDLFHGGQLTVLGRYSGQGHVALKLTGTVGKEPREFVYEVDFPTKTTDTRDFVEHLWAGRKVGYLLDQIRVNGESKELVEEVTALAKKYGITTPYTSFLIVPDGPAPVAARPAAGGVPLGLVNDGARLNVREFASRMQNKPGALADNRGKFAEETLRQAAAQAPSAEARRQLLQTLDKKESFDRAKEALQRREYGYVQSGKVGVDLSVDSNRLRFQDRLTQTAQKQVYGRNCLEVGGVWIDEGFDPKQPTVTVKAMSDAYFRILERHPKVREVFQLGNHLVWVTPSGTNLVIDTAEGKEKLTDEEIDQLFAARK